MGTGKYGGEFLEITFFAFLLLNKFGYFRLKTYKSGHIASTSTTTSRSSHPRHLLTLVPLDQERHWRPLPCGCWPRISFYEVINNQGVEN